MDAYPPTAADYANANAEGAQRAVEREGKKRAGLEEQVKVLQGQVAFLAGMVHNMNTSLVRPAPEDMDRLDRIRAGKD